MFETIKSLQISQIDTNITTGDIIKELELYLIIDKIFIKEYENCHGIKYNRANIDILNWNTDAKTNIVINLIQRGQPCFSYWWTIHYNHNFVEEYDKKICLEEKSTDFNNYEYKYGYEWKDIMTIVYGEM